MENKATLRVLVVDDDKDTADTLALLILSWGYSTRACYDAEAALQTASQFVPHIAFLDIAMPKIDGFSLAKKLRDQLPDIFLVAHTGRGSAEMKYRAAVATFNQFLIKPSHPTVIRSILQQEEAAMRSS